MTETADGPRYVAPARLRAGATVLVHNATDQFDEAVFVPVRPDATEADVQAFFEHLDCCGWPADSPFTGFPQGAPVLSPGGGQLIQPGLTPGRYALVTWVSGPDGHLLGAAGQHTLVTVV